MVAIGVATPQPVSGKDLLPPTKWVYSRAPHVGGMPFADPEFRTDLERMLVYHSWSRNKYLDLFARLPWRVLTRRRGSTFESIRNVHVHVLQVYAWWLVNFFGQRQLHWILKLRKYPQSVRQLRRMNREIDRAAQRVARRLGPNDFDRKRIPPSPLGQEKGARKWRITPREVLWHMVEEDFLHHGEILCMLWQDDIEPPYTGVWWFEYDHNPPAHQDLWLRDPAFPRPSSGGFVKKARREAAS